MSYSVNFVRRSILFLSLLFVSGVGARAQNIDIDVLRDVNLNRNKSLDGTMKVFTQSALPMSAALPLTQLIVGYVRNDADIWEAGLQTATGLCINTVLSVGLKYGVNRTRPYVTYPYLQPYHTSQGPSFPSAHTSYAFCSATSLALCYPKWYVIVPSYMWAITVSYSRMHLGVHYPTDILAGAIIGAGSAWLAHQGNKWLRRKKEAIDMME